MYSCSYLSERETYVRATSRQPGFRPLPSLQSGDARIASQRHFNRKTPFTAIQEKHGKANWARPEGLVSLRLKAELEDKEAKAAEAQRYLKEPGIHESFPCVVSHRRFEYRDLMQYI